MKPYCLSLMLVLLCLSALPVFGKPVNSTTLDEAIAAAPIVCVVESVGLEFDDLQPGETRTTDQFFFLETRYRVRQVLRDAGHKLAPDEILKVREKSNTCLVWTDTVRKEGNALIFSHPADDGSGTMVEQRIELSFGTMSILFLQEDLTHFGWHISPHAFDEAIVERLRTTRPQSGQ